MVLLNRRESHGLMAGETTAFFGESLNSPPSALLWRHLSYGGCVVVMVVVAKAIVVKAIISLPVLITFVAVVCLIQEIGKA